MLVDPRRQQAHEPHPRRLRGRLLQDLPHLRARGIMPHGAASRPGRGPVIALTGATGFLGSHIADELLDSGFRVRASIRPTSDLRWIADKDIESFPLDLSDAAACTDFVRGVRAVIHCAGRVTAPDDESYLRANVETTRCLLAACRREWHPQGGGSFLLISSLAAHGPAAPARPAREDDPCRPVTGYGRSKVAAEKLLLEHDHPFRTVVLRPPALYGPRDRGFLPLVKAALRGWTVRFTGPMAGLSLVHGRDAARAAVSLLETPEATGVFFVDDGHRGYDNKDLTSALALACGRKVRTVTVPLGLLKFIAGLLRPLTGGGISVLRADRLKDLEVCGWACDGSRLGAATGFSAAHDAASGFADTVAFYRRERWL
ncbi:hypothetical protein CO151_00725 [bacterium CG_4_9_14_3_um_filter_65_15]|nr:MAG: hypothetical protein CO151_00725 [bacterium CG_4_9_14_3_um_filter_65_15]